MSPFILFYKWPVSKPGDCSHVQHSTLFYPFAIATRADKQDRQGEPSTASSREVSFIPKVHGPEAQRLSLTKRHEAG